jgi:hypothetical protein
VGSLNGRVRRLEGRLGSEAAEPQRNYLIWHVLETIQIHKWGGSVYQATDRELNIVGMLVASNELPDGAGVYTFPSGATVTLTRTGDGESIQAEGAGRVEVEDLPEGIRRYFARMDPTKQPERERQLYELLEGGQWGA